MDKDREYLDHRFYQPLALSFREIDGKYYVTDPHNRQVVILNATGFQILKNCHESTIEELKVKLRSCNFSESDLSERNLADFVKSLSEIGLLTTTCTIPNKMEG